jgi:uroporphyrinogen-III synthase
MAALQGVGVIVTRPEQQSTPLCRLLEAQGAQARRLPVIEIRGLDIRKALQGRSLKLEQFDFIIFTSVNAVRFGAELLDQRRDLHLAAIGPATARALNQAGYRVSLQPTEGFDSEGLLAHPKLQSIAGRQVLLVKGQGGRHLLQEALAERGARVEIAEVYARAPAAPSSNSLAALETAIASGELHAITATSVDIGSALLTLPAAGLRAQFERLTWVVPAERVATELRAQGLKAPILIAESAEDNDLLAALIAWREGAVQGSRA